MRMLRRVWVWWLLEALSPPELGLGLHQLINPSWLGLVVSHHPSASFPHLPLVWTLPALFPCGCCSLRAKIEHCSAPSRSPCSAHPEETRATSGRNPRCSKQPKEMEQVFHGWDLYGAAAPCWQLWASCKNAEKSSPSLTWCDPALGCARGCDGGDASRLLLDNSGIDQEPFRGR